MVRIGVGKIMYHFLVLHYLIMILLKLMSIESIYYLCIYTFLAISWWKDDMRNVDSRAIPKQCGIM